MEEDLAALVGAAQPLSGAAVGARRHPRDLRRSHRSGACGQARATASAVRADSCAARRDRDTARPQSRAGSCRMRPAPRLQAPRPPRASRPARSRRCSDVAAALAAVAALLQPRRALQSRSPAGAPGRGADGQIVSRSDARAGSQSRRAGSDPDRQGSAVSICRWSASLPLRRSQRGATCRTSRRQPISRRQPRLPHVRSRRKHARMRSDCWSRSGRITVSPSPRARSHS